MKPNTIKTIIVEDEKAAQKALQSYLTKYCPQVEVVGTAMNGIEGAELIRTLEPELVFLDVEMPHANAFDLLEATVDIEFQTIFITAYAEYAIRALNMSAAYYLLKPINIEELILAVNKVVDQLASSSRHNVNAIVRNNWTNDNPQQLVLPSMSGFDVVAIDKIIRLKGNGNFTNVYTTEGKEYMVCRFLKHFEELLPPQFIRVHRSHIINRLMIKSYNKSGYIELIDQTEVEISASYKESFLNSF